MNIQSELLKFLKKNIWVVILVVFVFWLAWNLKASKLPIIIHETVTQLVPDSVMRDTLIRQRDYWYNKWFGLKQLYDVLIEKWKQVKPETVYIDTSEYKFPLNWEWIVKIVKSEKACSVYTFKIDSVFAQGTVRQVLNDLGSISQLKQLISDSVRIDSVYGRMRKYVFPLKEDRYVITSKPEGIFVKAKKQSSFALLFGIGAEYSFEESTVYGKIYSELYYKDKIRVSAEVGSVGLKVGVGLNVLVLGRVRK